MDQKFDLDRLIRPAIKNLKPYLSAYEDLAALKSAPESAASPVLPDEFIRLDANELPALLIGMDGKNDFEEPVNRYPGGIRQKLTAQLAAVFSLDTGQVFLGNGSDEIIDILLRCFARPGMDQILSFRPGFAMYGQSARINDLEVLNCPLDDNFHINASQALRMVGENTRIIFICHPNNPTGNTQPAAEIERLLTEFTGLVVIDEAYIDFCYEESWLPRLNDYPNLIILRTFSKAMGLAGARVGIAFAGKEIISVMNTVRMPYNLGIPNMHLALKALNSWGAYQLEILSVCRRREELALALLKLNSVQKVYPSKANFLLVKTSDADKLHRELALRGILVRNRSHEPGCENCLRISIGSPHENRALIRAWEEIDGNGIQPDETKQLLTACETPRLGIRRRKTAETDISLRIDLDGTGQSNIDTGIGFLDHMLEQIARHGGIDLEIHMRGDLHIDPHHCVEDTAICLGEALRMALGSKAGIGRYGFSLPMDDARARVLLDLGGRSYFKWNVRSLDPAPGGLAQELFPHFFRSFCHAAACNLHIKARGRDSHHTIEAIFKAFARTLRMAVARSGNSLIPSTKELL